MELLSPFYEPWVGSRYSTSSYYGKKLLLVGESSFEREFTSDPDPNHLRKDTASVVAVTFPPKYSGFWRYLYRSMTGVTAVSAQAHAQFWESVALVNLVQRPMSDKLKRPSYADYTNGASALKSYVDKLRPVGVIVLSKGAWQPLRDVLRLKVHDQKLLSQGHVGSAVIAASNQSYASEVLGPEPLFLLIRHPSARPKRSAIHWHPLIAAFIRNLGSAS